MLRGVIILVVALLASACGSLFDGVQQAALSSFQQRLATVFSQRLSSAIDWVVDDLASDGGFLDDPLVRILLPPPVGLVLDTSRDLRKDPQAALLETLINRAAENAVPVAGPLIKEVLTTMDAATLSALASSPQQAATQYLQASVGPALETALAPVISEKLQETGAQAIYGELFAAQQASMDANAAAPSADVEAPPMLAPEQLGEYVAEQAVGGVFRKLARKELAIRDDLSGLGMAQ